MSLHTSQTEFEIYSSLLLRSLPSIRHAFGTRKSSLPNLTFPNTEWDAKRPRWKQVHGTAMKWVTAPHEECGEVDALATRQRNLPIGIVTADCVPILLAKKDGSAVATVHAGWRGTYARIVEKVLLELEPDPRGRNNWIAAIGPCAGTCCYEVSVELAEQFRNEFGSIATPEPHRARNLDLTAVNRQILLSSGLQEIDSLKICTLCTRASDGEYLFHSFRRDGVQAGRQISCIEIQI